MYSFPVDESLYFFVSENTQIRPQSVEVEWSDLLNIRNDMETLKILNERGIGTTLLNGTLSQNEWHVLQLATRLGYCCSCGRFAENKFDDLRNEIINLGRLLCPKHFDSSLQEAVRFITAEPQFMAEQCAW